MSGVRDPRTIDLVAQEADGTILLEIVQSEPWTDDPEQTELFEEKVRTDLSFVDHGLVERYPQAAGKPIRIRLDCVESPSGHLVYVADFTATVLLDRGIAFEISTRRADD
jgi:hypothetical protein